jgi:hypothetical protein
MRALAAVGAGVLVAGIARARLRNWGATPEEIDGTHPGDDLVAGPVTTTTYAVTVQAPTATVWSWLVQIGQNRGGMYSYEWLENLFGLDIHNADRIHEEWQLLAVGDAVRIVPRGRLGMREGYAFRVALVDPHRALVLRQQPPEHPWDSTWAFLVVPDSADRCRLLSRSRTAKASGVAGLAGRVAAALTDPVILLMTRKMLVGIKRRAEHDVRRPQSEPAPNTQKPVPGSAMK